MLRFDLRRRDEIFFNDPIGLDQGARAVTHADARAIGAVEGITPVLARCAVIDAHAHVIPHQTAADAAVPALTQRDRSCGAAVVDHPHVFDDEIAALDRQDTLVSRLHLPLGPCERQITNFGLRGVFDLDDRLIVTLLNDAPRPKKPAALATDANLLRDRIITRWDKDHPVRIRIQSRLDGRIRSNRQLRRRSVSEHEKGKEVTHDYFFDAPSLYFAISSWNFLFSA